MPGCRDKCALALRHHWELMALRSLSLSAVTVCAVRHAGSGTISPYICRPMFLIVGFQLLFSGGCCSLPCAVGNTPLH